MKLFSSNERFWPLLNENERMGKEICILLFLITKILVFPFKAQKEHARSPSMQIYLHTLNVGKLHYFFRTIQYNMLKMRDKYLHTNCLAAMANMSSQFKNLHPYVAQRIVSLFETLARKHSRLVDGLQVVGRATLQNFSWFLWVFLNW